MAPRIAMGSQRNRSSRLSRSRLDVILATTALPFHKSGLRFPVRKRNAKVAIGRHHVAIGWNELALGQMRYSQYAVDRTTFAAQRHPYRSNPELMNERDPSPDTLRGREVSHPALRHSSMLPFSVRWYALFSHKEGPSVTCVGQLGRRFTDGPAAKFTADRQSSRSLSNHRTPLLSMTD